MPRNQLIINDITADLSEDAVIAITFQINNLAELKDRQATYSNQFDLPTTNTNKAIWGQAQSPAYAQKQAYRRLPVKYIANGIEIISNGLISLENASTENFSCQITYGITGISDLINKKSLRDLDLFSYGLDYSYEGIINSQSNIYGWIWPVIDYGQLPADSNIDMNYLRPAWFHRTLVDEITKLTGYTFTGKIFNDPQYLSELVPFSNDEYYPLVDNPAINLPDIDLKDFLKDWMQRYFLIPDVDNVKKVINFISLDDINSNKSEAKEWTDKIVRSDNETAFAFGEYAQVNTLSYLEEDAIILKNYGQGKINVDNQNLDGTKDLVTSVFAPSLMLGKIGIVNVSEIKRINGTVVPTVIKPFEIKVKPRILYNKVYSNNGSFNFTDYLGFSQMVDTISVPYFKGYNLPGLPYSELITRYAQGLLTILDDFRIVNKKVNLTALDIYQLDLSIPIFDRRDGCYYYINSINNWRAGKICDVSLIRM